MGGQEASFWRSRSPWYLRRQIKLFMKDIDCHDTESERDWRYFGAILLGLPDPGKYALRFKVEGSTLVIDTREDES